MKKFKFFGNNIEVSCDYCTHSQINNGTQFCTISKVLKNGKCRKFEYNPIMREPKRQIAIPKFKEEDFAI